MYTFSSLAALKLSAEPDYAAVLPARKNFWYYSPPGDLTKAPIEESLLSEDELLPEIKKAGKLVTSRQSSEFTALIHAAKIEETAFSEENFPFSSVYHYALKSPSANGIIKPNYIMESAAETNFRQKMK